MDIGEQMCPAKSDETACRAVYNACAIVTVQSVVIATKKQACANANTV